MTSEQYLAHALNSEKKLLALIDEFTAQIYPPDSPAYRKAENQKRRICTRFNTSLPVRKKGDRQ